MLLSDMRVEIMRIFELHWNESHPHPHNGNKWEKFYGFYYANVNPHIEKAVDAYQKEVS